MPDESILPISFFRLRALVWYDAQYNTFVAECLETGNVVSADDVETAKSMIVEVIQDEVQFTLANSNIRNLFDVPASLEVWKRYYELSKNHNADLIQGIEVMDATLESASETAAVETATVAQD